MKIVLTGATGLTGSALLRLLANEHEVFALHRPGALLTRDSHVSWIEQDLSRLLDAKLPSAVDAVVHLAQSHRYRDFPEGAVDMFQINTAMTVSLLRYCVKAGGSRFVYASSGAIYPPGPRAVREDDTPRPQNFYGMSKLVGEQVVDQFRDILTVASLRFFFIYGPAQRNMLIPNLAAKVQSGEPVPVAGRTGIRINPIYVDDAATAIAGALRLTQPGTFNVAGSEIRSICEIVTLIAEELGVQPRFTHGPEQPDLIAETQRMREQLAVPTITLRDGLRRVLHATVVA
jgi:nucleoside-diphosphate-sugar epimerase